MHKSTIYSGGAHRDRVCRRSLAFDRLEETLNSDLAAGAITPDYANFLRKTVRLMFKQGPLGINWLWEATLITTRQVLRSNPSDDGSPQALLVGETGHAVLDEFHACGRGGGSGTVPMEGFSAGRLRRSLDLPRSWEPILVVPVGYTETSPPRSSAGGCSSHEGRAMKDVADLLQVTPAHRGFS